MAKLYRCEPSEVVNSTARVALVVAKLTMTGRIQDNDSDVQTYIRYDHEIHSKRNNE